MRLINNLTVAIITIMAYIGTTWFIQMDFNVMEWEKSSRGIWLYGAFGLTVSVVLLCDFFLNTDDI